MPNVFYLIQRHALLFVEHIKYLHKNKKCITVYYMVRYSDDIVKKIQKRLLPQEIFVHFNNAFISLDVTKDLKLFDIKQLKQSENKERVYYRIRKGKYRAIFYLENNDIYIIALDTREEVYKRWR